LDDTNKENSPKAKVEKILDIAKPNLGQKAGRVIMDEFGELLEYDNRDKIENTI
jgi:hypothetical protein